MPETIFALSTGVLPSAVAIVRVSGPAAGAVVAALTQATAPSPRHATLRALRDADGAIIDQALVLFWRGPASFTGEDVAEFHVHGGRAVVAKLLTTLGRRGDCRPAQAGEFTRQAFLNGRMDLTAVEGLGDLIAAETEAQRRAALSQMSGALRRQCDALSARLVRARALLEAAIDFADESDVPEEITAQALLEIGAIRSRIAALLAEGRPAERLRNGLTVVLVGAPNAGKSSLMNALAGRDVAIVSAEAGTTRDVLSVDLDLAGYAVRLFDTAGLREAESAVEREGVRRAKARAETADLVLLLQATDEPAPPPIVETTAPVWRLRSKADLAAISLGMELPGDDDLAISTRTEDGLDVLLARLSRFAADSFDGGDQALVLQERQRGLLQLCGQHLENALLERQPSEVVAEEARLALAAMGSITGAVSTEAVLGAIFSSFCIGK